MILEFSSTKKKNKQRNKNQRKNTKKVTMKNEVYTTFLVSCVVGTMMIAINKPCWDYTLISLKKMIENHENMVPNAFLTRK